MKTILIVFTAAIIAFSIGRCQEAPLASIAFRLVDENGGPIPNGTIAMSTFVRWQPGEGFGTDIHDGPTGISNSDGRIALSYPSKTGNFGYRVRDKEGYYPDKGNDYVFHSSKAGRWQPWNPDLQVVLRKIVNPIPMYMRKLRVEFPALDEPLGFDLEVSDWVAPYGRGMVKDFIFTLTRKWVDKKNFDVRLTLSFSNSGDGIQNIEIPKNYGSELRLPRIAPEGGYQAQLSTSVSRLPGQAIQNQANDSQNYIYRVRTVLDDKRQVQSALYGKIHGDFGLDPIRSKTGIVLFTYYLNPTSLDRNLESDPKRNLFTNLKPSEKIDEP